MKKLLVSLPPLTAAHRESISRAAAVRGYEAVFDDRPEQAVDAEILLTGDFPLIKAAKELKWLCVPSAGVDSYVSPEIYGNPSATLSNSSGAYGVTIAEHIVMTALQLMRRQPEYAKIVARRSWERQLPVRSLAAPLSL